MHRYKQRKKFTRVGFVVQYDEIFLVPIYSSDKYILKFTITSEHIKYYCK